MSGNEAVFSRISRNFDELLLITGTHINLSLQIAGPIMEQLVPANPIEEENTQLDQVLSCIQAVPASEE